MNEKWRANIELIVKVVGTAIAFFGILKYFVDASDGRKLTARSAALSYVAIYNDVEMREHRKRLFEFWIRNADALGWMQENGVSESEYRSFMLVAFEHEPGNHDLLNSVYAMTTFYGEVYLCESSKVCDPKIIKNDFCEDAKDFLTKYKPIFAQLGALTGTPKFANDALALGRPC